MTSTLRKFLPSFSASASANVSRAPSPKHPDATQEADKRPKGAPKDLGMEDLLSAHLADRAARMFAAEEAETRQTLRVRAAQPNPAPATQESIPPPLPRVRARPASFIPSQQQQAVTRPITEADLVEAEAQFHGIPHLHPLANSQIHPDPLADLTRTDLQKVRNAALTEISRIMKDTKTAAETKKAAIKMTRVRDACRSTGVPFGELLEVEVEGFGMVPLIIEIVRCDFQQAPDLLLFLLEHSSKNLRWKVRRGCMLRNDSSNLYETLRHLVPSDSAGKPWDPPPFEYETSIEERLSTALLPPNLPPPSTDANEFRAMISIPNFPSSLLNDAIALAKRRHTPSEKLTGDPESESQRIDALLRAEAGLVVEFIACKKCWTLEVGSNRLVLTLVDGEPVRVADARVTVVKEERPAFLPRLKIEPIPGLENMSSGGGPRRSASEGETAQPVAVPQSVRRNTPPSPVPDSSTSYGQQAASPYGTLPRSGGPSRTPICPAVADLFKSLPPPPRMSTSPPEVHFTLEPPTPLRRVPKPNGITDPDFFSTEPNATSSSNMDIALNSPSLNGPAPPRPPRPARPLLLPRATLHPMHYSKGQHRTVLAPCFPNYATTTSFVKSVLSSKELLIELVVRLEKVNAPHHAAAAFQQPLDSGDEDEELVGAGMEVRRASVGGRSLFSGEDGGDSDVEVSSVVPESVNLITFSEDTHEKLPGPSGSGSGTAAPVKGQKPKRPTLLIPGISPSGARSYSAEWSPARSSSYHL